MLLENLPTYWGTTECQQYPDFLLQNYQPQNSSNEVIKYMESYTVDDLISTDTEIIIIGLYYADSTLSQQYAQYQQELGNKLIKQGYIITNIVINNYAPYSCTQETKCQSTFWYKPWKPWTSPECENFIAGCAPDDVRLKYENWQAKLIDIVSDLPVLQDVEWEDAWNRLGGGENDIFVYDSTKRLYKYICSKQTCGESAPGQLDTDDGFDYVYDLISKANGKDSKDRCEDFHDDTVKDYGNDDKYYSYGDDKYQSVYDDYPNSVSDPSDQDPFANNIKRRNRLGIGIAEDITLGGLLFTCIIITLIILASLYVYNIKKEQGDIEMTYTPLRTQDPFDENDDSLNQLEEEDLDGYDFTSNSGNFTKLPKANEPSINSNHYGSV